MKLSNGQISLAAVLCVLVVGAMLVTFDPSVTDETIPLSSVRTTLSWGYETKYTLNITAPIEATHYKIEMGSSYLYLGEEYYDVTEVPENRIIEVHRTGFHQVTVLYWVQEENQYYSLIGMGVYED